MDSDDFIMFVFGVFLVGAVIFIGFALFSLFSYQGQFNAWLDRCRNDGGQVQLYNQGMFSDDYECMKNGQIIDHVN